MGNPLLTGTEAIACRPYKILWEIYCLLVAHIQDAMNRFSKSTNNYLFLLIHMGLNARRELEWITETVRSLVGCKETGNLISVLIDPSS